MLGRYIEKKYKMFPYTSVHVTKGSGPICTGLV